MSESQKEQKERKKAIIEELPEIPPLLRITPEGRSVYPIELTTNKRNFSEIHIDSHCFKGSGKKHITPELIYYFAMKLHNNKEPFIPEDYKEGWEYFAEEIFTYEGKPYRLAWCWHDDSNFIGIRTCTRIRKVKKYRYDGKEDK